MVLVAHKELITIYHLINRLKYGNDIECRETSTECFTDLDKLNLIMAVQY